MVKRIKSISDQVRRRTRYL